MKIKDGFQGNIAAKYKLDSSTTFGTTTKEYQV